MSAKKITEKKLAEILSELCPDARDAFVLARLDKNLEVPKPLIKETASHFVQKDPIQAAKLYLLAGEKREAFKIYDKHDYTASALKIIEEETTLFTNLECYHFYERHEELYKKGLKLAKKEGNPDKIELFKTLLKYTR